MAEPGIVIWIFSNLCQNFTELTLNHSQLNVTRVAISTNLIKLDPNISFLKLDSNYKKITDIYIHACRSGNFLVLIEK